MSASYKFTGQHILLRDTTPDDVEAPWRIITAPGGVPTASVEAYGDDDFGAYYSGTPTYRLTFGEILLWDSTAAASDSSKPWRPLSATGGVLGAGGVMSVAPLQSAFGLRVNAIEESFMAAWQSTLYTFFREHGVHEVQGGMVRFQKASLSFQSSYRNPATDSPALPQPMEGANIHLTWYTGGRPTWTPARNGYHKGRATVDFRVRASVKAPRADGLNSEGLSRTVADSLFAVLSDAPSMKPLFQAGIINIRPSQPKLATTEDWACRIVNCEMDLLIPEVRATLPPPNGPGWRHASDLQLWDSTAYASDHAKPWRGIVCTDRALSLMEPAED